MLSTVNILTSVNKTREFWEIKTGEYFTSGDSLYTKIGNSAAIRVKDGIIIPVTKDIPIVPVDVEIRIVG